MRSRFRPPDPNSSPSGPSTVPQAWRQPPQPSVDVSLPDLADPAPASHRPGPDRDPPERVASERVDTAWGGLRRMSADDALARVSAGADVPLEAIDTEAGAAGFADTASPQDAGASSIIGGSWVGVDETTIEVTQGVRVDGEVEREIDGISRALDELGLSRCAAEDAQRWPLAVVATGRDYARVWALNALLLLLTAGLYYPWARSSRLQYLDGHTLLAGMPLQFLGRAWRLMRGLAAMLLAAGSVATVAGWAEHGEVWAAWVALLWVPALHHARVRHRIEHSSWQGLRFHFDGGWLAAYAAFSVPIMLGLSAALLAVAADSGPTGTAFDPNDAQGPVLAAALLALLALAAAPLAAWMVLRYHQIHLRLGPLKAQWHVDPVMMYRAALPMGAAWLVWGGIAVGLGWWATRAGTQPLGVLVVLPLLWVLAAVPKAHTQWRLQNLVWNHTGNRYLRFRSELDWGGYWRQQLKHHVLILLTLGIYTPWAAVHTRRMRLAAVSVISRIVPDELVVGLHNPTSQLADSRFSDEMTGLRLGW